MGLPQQGTDEVGLANHVKAGKDVGDIDLRALPADGRGMGGQSDTDLLTAVNEPLGVDVRIDVAGELGGVMTLGCEDCRQAAAQLFDGLLPHGGDDNRVSQVTTYSLDKQPRNVGGGEVVVVKKPVW